MNNNVKRLLTNLTRWTLLLTFGMISCVTHRGDVHNQTHTPQPVAPFDFKGRFIVSVSDADMVASAYSDGKLGPTEGMDALSVVRLDKPPRKLRAVEIGASNSVTGPPAALAVTPDGRYAIVTERLGQRPVGKAELKLTDLPFGKTIVVVDLSDPDKPNVVQRIDGFERVNSVSVNADGSLVAMSFSPRDVSQSPLVIYRFGNGQLSAPSTPIIPGWTFGDDLIGAEFHPKENTLALLNVKKPALSFVRVVSTNGGISLSPWGNSITVENAPFLAHFTPDGRHVIINASYTGAEFLGKPFPRGAVLTVRVAASIDTDGSPQHRLVSHAQTSIVPEGLSISPDGRWVITTNLEYSSQTFESPQQSFFSSLTLLRLDPQTGKLDRVGNFAYDGILPETAVFDNSSRYLAVTTFDHYDDRQPSGSIDFWRITQNFVDPLGATLVKTGYSVPVTRGVHSMVIVR